MPRALIADRASEVLDVLHSHGSPPDLQIVCLEESAELVGHLAEQFDIVVLPEISARSRDVLAALRSTESGRTRVVLVATQQRDPYHAPLDAHLVHGVLARSINAQTLVALLSRIALTLGP